MPSPLFYLFAAIMVAGGLMVVLMRNPVSSALSMVISFLGLAGLFIGLNSYFVGILQILVYAGAIMVLFIFIIMLLDVKKEEKDIWRGKSLAVGILIPLILLIQLAGVLSSVKNSPQTPPLNFEQALQASQKDGSPLYKEGTMIHKRLIAERLPDTHLIGHKLFTDYNFPLQVIAVLLLVATVGCVTLSRKSEPLLTKSKAPKPRQAIPKSIKSSGTKAQEETPLIADTAKTKKSPSSKLEAQAEKKKTPLSNSQSKAASTAKPSSEKQATNSVTDENRGLIYTAQPDDADDLKTISGIGPVLEKKLNGFGIYTFKQIENWTGDNIIEFDKLLSFKGRITRDNWLTQAAELNAKKNA